MDARKRAEFLPDGAVRFSVWAPRVNRLAVRFLSPSWTVQMDRHPDGLHTVTGPGTQAG